MKHEKTLEEQLRSWTPRRPSLKTERALFGERQFTFTLPRLAGILTPPLACLMVTVSLWQQVGQPVFHDGAAQSAVIAMSMSNQNYAPYLATSFQPTANRWDTFEWTNRGYSKSSVDSFTPNEATDLQ